MTDSPRPPVSIWIGCLAFFAAIAVEFAGTLWCFWLATDDYVNSSFLTSWIGEVDVLFQVLLVTALAIVVVLVGASSGIAGFYGLKGYRWARVAGVIAFGVSALALFGSYITWSAIGFTLIGMVCYWLPPSIRYFAAWELLRYPPPTPAPVIPAVEYGPLPKYREVDAQSE
ncbi:MAG: hypothetical protein LBR20_05105 [Propionibacteriaceae bacterium]|jgi:hypothetical protein|nr:hypothetical protein [Propionibacteriaceae bacterium]